MSFFLISLLVLLIVSLLYLISFWASMKRGSFEKLSPYESGFEPTNDARIKFDILYWKIALLYLIFDLELLFLFPYGAIISYLHSLLALYTLILFLAIITLAFLYEYLRGALSLHS